MNLSASPFLSLLLHSLLNFSISRLPFFSAYDIWRLNPLLLDLEASLILSRTTSSPSSSSIISFFFFLITASDCDLLLFLIRYSTSEPSRPWSSRTSLNFSIDLFLLYAVLFLFRACSSRNACFFLFISLYASYIFYPTKGSYSFTIPYSFIISSSSCSISSSLSQMSASTKSATFFPLYISGTISYFHYYGRI